MLKKIILLIFILGLLFSCGESQENQVNSNPIAFVSIPPQKFIVEKLLGESVEVKSFLDELDDPHSFQPKPRQLEELSSAVVYIRGGLSFESSFIKDIESNLPNLQIVNQVEEIELLPLISELGDIYIHEDHDDHEDHEGNDDHEDNEDHDDHDHGLIDPHFWLSIKTVCETVNYLTPILKNNFPDIASEIDENAEKLQKELNALYTQFAEQLEPFDEEILLVYHPAFGYFAHDFHLQQLAIEIGGKEPSPKELETILKTIEELHIPVLFVQPQFSQLSAKLIQDATDVNVLEVNPLSYNLFENIEAMTNSFINEQSSEQ